MERMTREQAGEGRVDVVLTNAQPCGFVIESPIRRSSENEAQVD